MRQDRPRRLPHDVHAVVRLEPDQGREVDQVEAGLHQPGVADHHVDALLHLVRHPCFPLIGGHGVSLHHRHPEPVPGEDVLHPPGDVPGPRVGHVDQRPAPRQPLRRHQVHQGLLLGVELLLGQGRHLDDDVARPGVEDRLALGAAFGVGEERLQVRCEQPFRAALERLRQLLAQFLVHRVVGAALGVARRVLLRVHRGQEDLLVVVRKPRRHVGQPQEHGVADDVEEGRWDEARPLPHHLAELAPLAVAPVLHRVVVGLADGDLLEAVALYPAVLVGAPELCPDLR